MWCEIRFELLNGIVGISGDERELPKNKLI